MNLSKNIVFLAVVWAMMGLLGCAKERTIEDWRRDRVAEQLAQIQAKSGTYNGFAQLPSGEKIGFSLTVEPDTEISTTRDSISTAPQASLQGRIRIYLEKSIQTLRFRGGYIDPNNGGFKAEIPIVLRNGLTEEFSISGMVDGSVANGRIGAALYPELSASFQAQVGTDVFPSEKIVSAIPKALDYQGEIMWADGSRMTGDFKVTQSPATSEQELYDLFDEIRWVHLELQVNKTQYLIPAQWRTQEKRMIGFLNSGALSTPSTSYSARMECTERVGGAVLDGWDCEYINVSASPDSRFKVQWVLKK